MDILVVDDDPGLRAMLAAQLLGEGHLVETACDGLQALERLRIRRYDLVLTDLQMPGLDGVGLIREAERAGIEAVWVVLTGDPQDDRLRGQAAPVLRKPFRLDQLRQLVDMRGCLSVSAAPRS